MRKGEVSTKLVYLLIGLVVLIYVGYQLYKVNYNPLTTELALNGTIYDTVRTEGFAVREEQIVLSNLNGTLVADAEDGSKVKKGGTIARVFRSEEQASSYLELVKVQSQIDYYEKLKQLDIAGAIDLDTVDSAVSQSVNQFIRTAKGGTLKGLDDAGSGLVDSILSRQLLVGEQIDVEGILSRLASEKSALAGNVGTSESIRADESGYFIGTVDGYENSVDFANVDSLSAKDVKSLLNGSGEPTNVNQVGKIVGEFNWYIVCSVERLKAGDLSTGQKVTIDFPNSTAEEVSAVVHAINSTVDDSGDVAVILKCTYMDARLAKLRKETVEVRFQTYSGIRISKSALRTTTIQEEDENGELVEKNVKCVYVLAGNMVRERLVDVLYTGEDFVIVKDDNLESGYIRLYDKVITKGKDLYDGKLVKAKS